MDVANFIQPISTEAYTINQARSGNKHHFLAFKTPIASTDDHQGQCLDHSLLFSSNSNANILDESAKVKKKTKKLVKAKRKINESELIMNQEMDIHSLSNSTEINRSKF
jgi:hypothetical protein